MICERCLWTTPHKHQEPIAVYRKPRKALELYIEARRVAVNLMAMHMEPNEVQAARESFPHLYVLIGEFTVCWAKLDLESRLVLRMSVEIPDWQENVRRCTKSDCRHIYGPIAMRCQRCTHVYELSELDCPKCHEYRSMPVWPTAISKGGQEVCPKCENSGARSWERVSGKAQQIASAVSDHRHELFVQHHGREPFVANEADSEHNEEHMVGYCWACTEWYRAQVGRNGGLSKRRVCTCERKPRIRWGLTVYQSTVGPLVGNAMGKWGHALKEKKRWV